MQMYPNGERRQGFSSDLKRQQACTSCWRSHLRCSGGPKCFRCQQEGIECLFSQRTTGRAEIATPLQVRTAFGFRASATCVNCQESHFKCTGGTTCTRCARSGKLCYYVSSRRGQRKKAPMESTPDLPPASSSDLSINTELAGKALCVDQSADTGTNEQENHTIVRQPHSMGTPEEQRALVFYCENMMPILIAANTATSHFWGRLVPQASQSEAAIRHMLVALSSWQEMINTSRSNRDKSFRLATQHHTKALAVLTQPRARPSVAVMLTACLLLIVREGTEDPVGQMSDLRIQHTLAGLQILREWKLKQSSKQGQERDTILNDIEPVFTQVEVVMSMFLPTVITVVPLPWHTRPQLPKVFTGHIQMRDTFCEIHRWRYYSPSGQSDEWTDSSPHFRDVQALLKEWYRILLLYLSDMSISFLERRVGALLWSQCRMLETALSFSTRTDVFGIESVRPLIVDLSQPGRTVIVRTRMASTLAKFNETYSLQPEGMIDSLLSASRRSSIASNHEPTGLWPIREVWQSEEPLEVVFVHLFAPASTGFDSDKLEGISNAFTARVDGPASKDAEEKQKNENQCIRIH